MGDETIFGAVRRFHFNLVTAPEKGPAGARERNKFITPERAESLTGKLGKIGP